MPEVIEGLKLEFFSVDIIYLAKLYFQQIFSYGLREGLWHAPGEIVFMKGILLKILKTNYNFQFR